jgi:hypothetical protein
MNPLVAGAAAKAGHGGFPLRRGTAIALLAALPLLQAPAASHPGETQPRAPAASMDERMLDIENRVRELQAQMQLVRGTAERQQRYRLLLEHLRSARATLDRMRGMEFEMAAAGRKDPGSADPALRRRQAVMEQMMDMMLTMLEQVALFQEPALQR